MAVVLDELDQLEFQTCLRINRVARRKSVREFFSVVSKLGDGSAWAAMAFAVYAAYGNVVLPQIAAMALTGIAGVAIYKLLKNRLIRERPYICHSAIECGTPPLDRYSFPSGHTLHAVSFTVMLVSIEPLTAVIALPFCMLVAASRVVLGLHYPSDVVVGAAIGAALSITAVNFYF
jgi:undecaprenyl-diphosphatase